MDGIVSKDRVKANGEVYTPDKIVCDMLKLPLAKLRKKYTDQQMLTATFLEPTCGNGNFLIRFLDRKLALIDRNLADEEIQISILKAVSSIYGIDILPDNIEMSKQRMMEVLATGHTAVLGEAEPWSTNGFSDYITPDFAAVVRYILDLNIQCGDALTGKQFICYKHNNNKVITKKGEELTQDLKITQYGFDGTTVGIRDINFDDIKSKSYSTDRYTYYGECNYLNLSNLKPVTAYTDVNSAVLSNNDDLYEDEDF